MKTRYRALVTFLVLMGFVAGFIHNGRYKLDPLDAARSSSQIGIVAVPFGQVAYPWGKIYLFKTAQGFCSVLVIKIGILWQNQGAMLLNETTDKVKTVGWQRVVSGHGHQATVLAVESVDERVVYIEAGNGKDRIRKQIEPGTPVIFSWDKALELKDLKPCALSSDEKVLYEYRYPRNQSTVNRADLRWYKP